MKRAFALSRYLQRDGSKDGSVTRESSVNRARLPSPSTTVCDSLPPKSGNEPPPSASPSIHLPPSSSRSQQPRRERKSEAEVQRNKKAVTRTLAAQYHPSDPPQYRNWPSDYPEDGLREIIEFARHSHKMITTEDVRTLLRDLRGEDKSAIMQRLPDLITHPPYYQCAVVVDSEQLQTELALKFGLIFIPNVARVGCAFEYNIARYFKDWGMKTAMVQLEPGEDAPFVEVSLEDLERDINEKSARAWNALNVRAPLIQFEPYEISEISLLHQIYRKSRGSIDRGSYTALPDTKWCILTHGPKHSPFHVDQAGKATAIVCLDGEKDWYVPSGDWARNVEFYQEFGQRMVNYPEGIGHIRLVKNSCFIQAPGTIHGVVTSNDALLAGSSFYTAAYFATSIRCIDLALGRSLPSNEWMKTSDCEKLRLIVEHLDDEDIFCKSLLPDIFMALNSLVRHAHDNGLVVNVRHDKELETIIERKAAKEIESFLREAEDWCKAYRSMLGPPEPESHVQEAVPDVQNKRGQDKRAKPAAGRAKRTRRTPAKYS